MILRVQTGFVGQGLGMGKVSATCMYSGGSQMNLPYNLYLI